MRQARQRGNAWDCHTARKTKPSGKGCPAQDAPALARPNRLSGRKREFTETQMNLLLGISRGIDWLNDKVGKLLCWLVLASVVVSSGNAVVRYLFNQSSNAWLELQWYMFSAVFLLCAGYTLLNNQHIRIDIVNSRLTPKTRSVIDVIGHVFFLIPLCVLLLSEGWPYFVNAYVSGEVSSNAGGLIRWPARLLIVLGFALLLAQAISELIKRIAIMRGLIPDPHAHKDEHGTLLPVLDPNAKIKE
jgi:TRAP-type mannitol/chloroaromatic compound transport system permease small subunit